MVLARSAVDAVLVQLAWPGEADLPGPRLARPRFLTSVLSCALLTVVVGLVMSPVVTLMFGVALLPFSWPYLAAVPILLGTAIALSQGGVGQAWWRRLPPAATAAWVVATFMILSAASALMAHLDTAGHHGRGRAGRGRRRLGLVRAHRWRRSGARRSSRRTPGTGAPPCGGSGRTCGTGPSWLPVAPLAAVLVLALVVGLARLAFTGTLRLHGAGRRRGRGDRGDVAGDRRGCPPGPVRGA